jgi:pimeloyl-ACP methyl ester carboxylesterase
MPGHGRSDKPEKEEAYGIPVVEDVVLLLDELKIKKAHVVGYSLGGIVAVKRMAKHPDRVLSGTVGGMGWFKEGSALQELRDKMPARDVGQTPAASPSPATATGCSACGGCPGETCDALAGAQSKECEYFLRCLTCRSRRLG